MKRLISLSLAFLLLSTTLLSATSISASAADLIKIACVGDSITAGSNEYNYPMYLQKILGDGYEVKNFGKGGAAVHHQEEAVGDANWGWGSVNDADGDGYAYFYYDDNAYTSSLAYDADYVFVMMGTNDVGSEDYSYYKTDYYDYLVKPYLDKGAEVIVMTSPTAYAYMLQDHNKINTTIRQMQIEIAEENNLTLIDMNTATAGRRESFPDGLHGNSSGYMIIAQTVYKEFFGGTVYTLTANAGDVATVNLDNSNADLGDYVFRTDENGVGTVPVLPGTYNATAESYVFTANPINNIAVAADTEITFTYNASSENYARNATVFADSQNENIKDSATDGDDTTRWQSASDGTAEKPAWLYLDFGQPTVFDSVVIFWEAARPSEEGYVLEYSNDAENWVTVTEVSRTRDEIFKIINDCITFDALTARYLRVYCTALENEKTTGPSIYEIEVYNVRSYSELTVARMTLENALSYASSLNESTYTPETWAVLGDAVSAGEDVMNSGSEFASDYVDAATAINNAINALESNAEGILNAAVNSANEVVRYRYSPEGLAVLDGYLAEAATYKGVTVDDTVAQKMTDCAANITSAIAALEINNLAVGKAVIIPSPNQSIEQKGTDDSLNDGDFTTRWASGGDSSTIPEHIIVDFGTETTVDILEIYWETARANESMITVQYSQDNVVWNDAENAAFSGDINNAVNISGNDCFYQKIAFDAVKARYIRLYIVGTGSFNGKNYTQMSIWELEAYNSVESELSEISAVANDFEILGAQTRDNLNGTKDLRFVVSISANIITNIETVNDDFTAIGVVMARHDQLEAAGFTSGDLALDADLGDVEVRNVTATYLRNINVDKYGMYTYTITIVGISDLDRYYSCRAYFTNENGTTYSVNTATKNANGMSI